MNSQLDNQGSNFTNPLFDQKRNIFVNYI